MSFTDWTHRTNIRNVPNTNHPRIGQDTSGMLSGMSKTPRLMGASEAAEALGVAQQNLRPIPGLPAPIAVLRCGSIWLASEIEAFQAGRSQAVAELASAE